MTSPYELGKLNRNQVFGFIQFKRQETGDNRRGTGGGHYNREMEDTQVIDYSSSFVLVKMRCTGWRTDEQDRSGCCRMFFATNLTGRARAAAPSQRTRANCYLKTVRFG
jgi:hypothetical protein